MASSSFPHIKIPFKKCCKVGNNTAVVIDKVLVQRLAISEEITMYEEELTEGGIILCIVRI